MSEDSEDSEDSEYSKKIMLHYSEVLYFSSMSLTDSMFEEKLKKIIDQSKYKNVGVSNNLLTKLPDLKTLFVKIINSSNFLPNYLL